MQTDGDSSEQSAALHSRVQEGVASSSAVYKVDFCDARVDDHYHLRTIHLLYLLRCS